MGGSSPRVRGTRATTRIRARCRAVHPRVCGERWRRPNETGLRCGSSPRVRGTHTHGPDRAALVRFIPACAGNAARPCRAAKRPPVHPRVCGERPPDRPPASAMGGSSPRVRGTRATTRIRARCRAVHPRVCGERWRRPNETGLRCGSSPRVRGTHTHGPDRAALVRFIPACAGNAARPCRAAKRPPVHPRVCGERSSVLSISGPLNGSSPRVRGTLQRRAARRLRRRFIPACAGNASSRVAA